MENLIKFQEAYQRWVDSRALIEKAQSAKEISADNWAIRSTAWREYCVIRDEMHHLTMTDEPPRHTHRVRSFYR